MSDEETHIEGKLSDRKVSAIIHDVLFSPCSMGEFSKDAVRELSQHATALEQRIAELEAREKAVNAINQYLVNSGHYLFYHYVTYRWYAFIADHENGSVSVDKVIFSGSGETQQDALAALSEKVKGV